MRHNGNREETKFTIKIMVIAGDNHCMFTALSYEISTKMNIKKNYLQLRNEVANFLQKWWRSDKSVRFIIEERLMIPSLDGNSTGEERNNHDEKIIIFIDSLRKKEWGGVETINAVMTLYDCNIFTIHKADVAYQTRPQLHRAKAFELSQHTLTILYSNLDHYDVVLWGHEGELKKAKAEFDLEAEAAKARSSVKSPEKKKQKKSHPQLVRFFFA